MNSLNKYIDESKKPYILIINNMDIDIKVFTRKIDLNINMFNKEINTLMPINNDQKNLDFYFIKNQKTNTQRNNDKFIMKTILPLGFLHYQLLRFFIVVSSINIDSEIEYKTNTFQMTFDGSHLQKI